MGGQTRYLLYVVFKTWEAELVRCYTMFLATGGVRCVCSQRGNMFDYRFLASFGDKEVNHGCSWCTIPTEVFLLQQNYFTDLKNFSEQLWIKKKRPNYLCGCVLRNSLLLLLSSLPKTQKSCTLLCWISFIYFVFLSVFLILAWFTMIAHFDTCFLTFHFSLSFLLSLLWLLHNVLLVILVNQEGHQRRVMFFLLFLVKPKAVQECAW